MARVIDSTVHPFDTSLNGLTLMRYSDGFTVRGANACTLLSYSLEWEIDDCCFLALIEDQRGKCDNCPSNMPMSAIPAFELAFRRAMSDFRNGKFKYG